MIMNQIQALEALEGSKFTKSQAKTLIQVLTAVEDRSATKNDLKVLKAELVIHLYTAAGLIIAFLSFIKFFEWCSKLMNVCETDFEKRFVKDEVS